jgi:type 1 glutamine amidotransferase
MKTTALCLGLLSVVGVVAGVAPVEAETAIAKELTVQIDVGGLLNVRPVTTLSADALVPWTTFLDSYGGGSGFLTVAAARALGDEQAKALPDNPLIPAHGNCPEMLLHYSNKDGVGPQARQVDNEVPFTIPVPRHKYRQIFLAWTSGTASELMIDCVYANGTNTQHTAWVRDYFNELSANDHSRVSVVRDLDKWNRSGKLMERGHHSIHAAIISPDRNRELVSLKVTKKASKSHLIFWAATGVLAGSPTDRTHETPAKPLPAASVAAPVSVLVVSGQNNHDWKATTPFMKGILDRNSHFQTTVSTTPTNGAPAAEWDAWRPKFSDYQCVLLDYNGQMWPEQVKKDFVEYVRNGGGVVLIHAANNAFSGWKEYEQMVGLLWRWWTYGYSLYVDDAGNVVREEPGKGHMMGHGDWAGWYEWTMTVRDSGNPITKEMPAHWLHRKDELYHAQRGPAENVHILLTAYSEPKPPHNGTGRNEPIVWWVPFGKGRVVTTVMGHNVDAMKCVGFQTLLLRSCEWAATGECAVPLPPNFPTAAKSSATP